MSYENPEDEADELAKAFLESRNMEQTRSYLERGRSYEELSKQELETKWVAAGNAATAKAETTDKPVATDKPADSAKTAVADKQ